MNYNRDAITGYTWAQIELIPLHPWNKMINGKERGKTPIDREWTTKKYNQSATQIEQWINSGYNLGYRIGAGEIVIDLDPRNYDDQINSEQLIAEFFGFSDFDSLFWELSLARTGSGGYHIYCTLPDGVSSANLRGFSDRLPGVDFKKLGGFVVATGSRHPNGGHYLWENIADRAELPQGLVDLLKRENVKTKNIDYSSGYGAFNNEQLRELILDKLNVSDYGSNDQWQRILMSAHHATAGEGIEAFLEWSLGDPDYANDSNTIRSRWESLRDSKQTSITVATLLHELKIKGEDYSSARAVIDFGTAKTVTESDPDFLDFDPEASESDQEDFHILRNVREAANTIDISAIYDTPDDKTGVDGAAIEAARALSKTSSAEDKMKVIRLIKAASVHEAIEAQEILIENKIMNQTAINKRLKAIEAKISDSITEVLANTTMDSVFKGDHILNEPNRQAWVFNKTHWKPIADEYLGKIVYGVLDTLKSKMDLEVNEVNLVTAAVRAIRMRSATLSSRLFDTEHFKPVINCANGEVWIKTDGTHHLKPHNAKSYQLRCLRVNYDPSAKCPLFMQTLSEIFELYPDRDDMIRHLGEVLGYVIQPYKPDANWWMFRGPGGDGKSTIIKILNGILGDALYSADESLLSTGSGYGNNHATADLVGKLAVVIQELKAGKALNDSGLKMLAENTKMTANPKNKDTFSFNYVGSLIMCCNFFPVIKDTSEGTVRRANVIPFNRQFVKNSSADSNRARKILENPDELAGVLNFMLEGYKRYSDRGHFDPPRSCITAKNEWLCEANNVIRFVNETMEVTRNADDHLGVAGDIYNSYMNWCDVNGVHPKGRNNFYNDLENLSIHRVKSTGGNWHLTGGVLIGGALPEFDEF